MHAVGSVAVPTHLALGPAQAVDCAVHERAQLLGPACQVPAGAGETEKLSTRACRCTCWHSVQPQMVGTCTCVLRETQCCLMLGGNSLQAGDLLSSFFSGGKEIELTTRVIHGIAATST
jgi:hypothetical protein